MPHTWSSQQVRLLHPTSRLYPVTPPTDSSYWIPATVSFVGTWLEPHWTGATNRKISGFGWSYVLLYESTPNVFNPLKPRGKYMYHLVFFNTKISPFYSSQCLCDLNEAHSLAIQPSPTGVYNESSLCSLRGKNSVCIVRRLIRAFRKAATWAQAVSRRPLIAETRVPSQAWSREILWWTER